MMRVLHRLLSSHGDTNLGSEGDKELLTREPGVAHASDGCGPACVASASDAWTRAQCSGPGGGQEGEQSWAAWTPSLETLT